jgi:NitT/TauT family transport system substrate-binding protein
MRSIFLFLSLVVALAGAPLAPAADRVKLALPAKSMGYLPLFAAVHRGFFGDQAIEIEISMLLPQLAHSALLSGEVDYHGVADSALRLAARGAPMKAIFFGAARPNYFLLAHPRYKSVAELRGKYLGMVRSGDTVELATAVAFARAGLDPRRDAIPIMIGLPATRVAALTAGSIDATIVVPPDNVLLKRKGFRELLFLGDAVEFPSNGFATTERQLREKSELTQRVLRALYRGLLFARERPDESIQVIQREWNVDPPVAREAYASLVKSFSADGAATEAGLKFHIRHIQATDQGIGDIPLSQIVDFRPLEAIRKEMNK